MSEEATEVVAEETAAPAETAEEAPAEEAVEQKTNGKQIATGAEEKPEEPVKETDYWPEDWREKIAEHAGAGDAKAVKKELTRLKRFTDPSAIYGSGREAEAKLTSGGLIKMPGKDASDEDIAAYHKAIGVPEKPEEYFDGIELENGAVIGDADKPIVDGFAAKMHEAGATQPQMNAALNWYYTLQEAQAADQDEEDDNFRVESQRELKEEMGGAFRRKTNAISGLFATAPGGTDVENENGLYSRLMAGRMADGKIIGNDPDMVRFLVGVAQEMYPAATVVDGGDQSGKGLEAELKEIKEYRRDHKRDYFKDEKMQARERELLEAQTKIRARA